MHAPSSHTPQPTTDNALHSTTEGTPIGLVHAHLVTSGGVQVVLVEQETDHFIMSFLSCPVDHGVSMVVNIVEHGVHFGGQVADGVDMATPCS